VDETLHLIRMIGMQQEMCAFPRRKFRLPKQRCYFGRSNLLEAALRCFRFQAHCCPWLERRINV
jgi:hypothetical protein